MTESELETFLANAYSRDDYEYLFGKARKDQDFFNMVWRMSCQQPFERSWRLLWILDHATEKSNTFIFPILEELYQMVLITQNESYIRQGMKLILRCPVLDDYVSPMLERCVVWMNDQKAKVSSQGMGIEFFYKVCKLYPELSSELMVYINDILERSPSAGIKVRLKKIVREFS